MEDECIVWGSCVIVLLEAACTTLTVEQFHKGHPEMVQIKGLARM